MPVVLYHTDDAQSPDMLSPFTTGLIIGYSHFSNIANIVSRKTITCDFDSSVSEGSVSYVECGNIGILNFNLQISSSVSTGIKLVKNMSIKAPLTNGIPTILHQNNTASMANAYLDSFGTNIGGHALVTAQTVSAGTYRASVVYIIN